MITLPGGSSFSFIASAGARGWAGRDEGHGLAGAWKALWRLPDIATVSKTVTALPRAGNYDPWRPWRTVRPLRPASLVNAMGLPNPGLAAWAEDYYPLVSLRFSPQAPFFLSVAPETPDEAFQMAHLVGERCPLIAGIEVNCSCPNTGAGPCRKGRAISLLHAVQNAYSGPIILKLGYEDEYIEVVREARPFAFHLINTVRHSSIRPGVPSPLAPLDGGISGRLLASYSRAALVTARGQTSVPIISGGGILDSQEASVRFNMGASAIGLGSVYLIRPWRVRSILREGTP